MVNGQGLFRMAPNRRKLGGGVRITSSKKLRQAWVPFLLPFLALLILIQLAQPFLRGGEGWWPESNIFHPPFWKPAVERTAICLAGGARSFELTGPSIRDRLLGAYPNSDVFLVVPFDADAHKLSLLTGIGNVVRAEVAPQTLMLEDDVSKELFDEYGSPNGVQGLLQYFALIENCQLSILAHERAHRLRYTWILRTRPDGFWNAPPPPLVTFRRDVYYAPNGVDFDGVNDRLAVGSRKVISKMLARSSTKRQLYTAGLRSANSEIALKAQLRIQGIPLERLDFPFCVITRRTFPFVDRPEEVPVVPIGSAVTLNGVYCKPCTPMLTGKVAVRKMGGYRKSLRWFGDPRAGAEICNSTAEWEGPWEGVFDARVGPQLAAARAAARRLVGNETLGACETRVGGLIREVPVWRGASARELCLIYLLGSPKLIGQVRMYPKVLRGPVTVAGSVTVALGRKSPVASALANISAYTDSTSMSPRVDRWCPNRERCEYPDGPDSLILIQDLPRKVHVGLLEVAGIAFASRLVQVLKDDPDLWVCQVVGMYRHIEADVQEWTELRAAFQELGFWQASCEWTTRNEAQCLLVSDTRCALNLL